MSFTIAASEADIPGVEGFILYISFVWSAELHKEPTLNGLWVP